MKKVGSDITSVILDEHDIIEYETKDCRIIYSNNKYYLQLNTDVLGWVFALERNKDLTPKEYTSYNAVMAEIRKWGK